MPKASKVTSVTNEGGRAARKRDRCRQRTHARPPPRILQSFFSSTWDLLVPEDLFLRTLKTPNDLNDPNEEATTARKENNPNELEAELQSWAATLKALRGQVFGVFFCLCGEKPAFEGNWLLLRGGAVRRGEGLRSLKPVAALPPSRAWPRRSALRTTRAARCRRQSRTEESSSLNLRP